MLTDGFFLYCCFAFCWAVSFFVFPQGDPNMVKLNVAITCGYLFYGMNHCFVMEVQAQIAHRSFQVCLHFLTLLFSLPSSLLLSDLVLLACNWSTMGDTFFVCHHLAALYAYGFVLVSTWKCKGHERPLKLWIFTINKDKNKKSLMIRIK